MTRDNRQLALAWTGLALGAGTWFTAHQLGSDLTIANCRASGALPVLLIGLIALALLGTGAFLSWRLWRSESAAEGRRFAAMLGMAVSGFFAFAILLQTIAALFLPSCWG
jgi:hypothetical protein